MSSYKYKIALNNVLVNKKYSTTIGDIRMQQTSTGLFKV